LLGLYLQTVLLRQQGHFLRGANSPLADLQISDYTEKKLAMAANALIDIAGAILAYIANFLAVIAKV